MMLIQIGSYWTQPFLNYSNWLKQKAIINCKAFVDGSACWTATKVIVKHCLYILNNNK